MTDELHAAQSESGTRPVEHPEPLDTTLAATGVAPDRIREAYTYRLERPAWAPLSAADYRVRLRVGAIGVTSSSVVTPVGQVPLHGSTFIVNDMSRVVRKRPRWAIALAIIGFFFFLLGLLFLLVKETTYSGSVVVSVYNGQFSYSTEVLIHGPDQANRVRADVMQMQQIALSTP